MYLLVRRPHEDRLRCAGRHTCAPAGVRRNVCGRRSAGLGCDDASQGACAPSIVIRGSPKAGSYRRSRSTDRAGTGEVDEAMTCRACGEPVRKDDSHVMGKAADSELWYVHAACLYGHPPSDRPVAATPEAAAAEDLGSRDRVTPSGGRLGYPVGRAGSAGCATRPRSRRGRPSWPRGSSGRSGRDRSSCVSS